MRRVRRAETGVMRFGKDWPGVFIRGDNAFHFSETLRGVLNGNDHQIARRILRGLADLLSSSNVHSGLFPGAVPQTLRAFRACLPRAKRRRAKGRRGVPASAK